MTDPDPRFAKTVFIVEADSYAQIRLWCAYSTESPDADRRMKLLDWKQDNPGFWRKVGEIDGRPVVVTCCWNKLN